MRSARRVLVRVARVWISICSAWRNWRRWQIRILVQPNIVTDDEAVQLARNISKKIEQELQYPGQIKVIVVREMRAVEYAK